MCFTCNKSKFNYQLFLETDRIAQAPHMPCLYADIAVAKYMLWPELT